MTYPSARVLRLVAGVAVAVLVAACTGQPAPDSRSTSVPPGSTAATTASTGPAGAPPQAFIAVEGVETGGYTEMHDVAATRQRAIAVGQYTDAISSAYFAYSDDGGRTWRTGSATPPPATEPEVALSVSVSTRNGRTTWAALGIDTDEVIGWASEDGASWTRTPLREDVFDVSTDDVAELVSTAAGFLAVGTRNHPDRGELPMTWRSADGVAWSAQPLPGAGEVDDVAVRGDTVVAVGSHDDDARVWRSADHGRTWKAVGAKGVRRAPIDTGQYRTLESVASHGSGFAALGTIYVGPENDYRPALYRSKDGRRWTVDPAYYQLAILGNRYARFLASDGKDLWAVLETAGGVKNIHQLAGGGWIPVADPAPTKDRAEWRVTGAARTSVGWLFTANRIAPFAATAHLWWSPQAGILRDTEELPVPRESPVTRPIGLVRTNGGWQVIGRSRTTHATWTEESPGRFGAPRAIHFDEQAEITGVTADELTVVAFGTTQRAGASDATVWTSGDGRRFTPTDRGAFEKVGRYASSSVQRVRRLGQTWFAVGDRSSTATSTSRR